MVSAGAYRKADACLMVHPAYADGLYGGYLAYVTVNVEYFGKAAHAAAAPWDGANALDAVVLAYNAIGMLRQQAHPMSRLTVIITNGGKTVSVTPDYASAKVGIRAQNRFQLLSLRQKLTQCLESAASATGCTLKTTWEAEYCGASKYWWFSCALRLLRLTLHVLQM
jgi:metal-dependent amidase/aminoacylase/carboxypeptidase family protein